MSLRLSSNTRIDSAVIQNTSLSLSPVYNDKSLISSLIVSNHENLQFTPIYKWYRLRNEKLTQLSDQLSNSYIVTCEDIDAYIQVEVVCQVNNSSAILKIGPLRLDRSVRKSLESILTVGFATFPLSCTGDLDYDNASDLVLEISRDLLRLKTFKKDGSVDTKNSFESTYTVSYPKITLHTSDEQKLSFEMNHKKTEEGNLEYSRRLLVSCLNQQTRDLILMSIRVFALQNSIKIDRALEYYINDIGKCKTDIYIDHSLSQQESSELYEENISLKHHQTQLKESLNSLTLENSQLKSTISSLEHKLLTLNQPDPKTSDFEKLKIKIEKLTSDKSELRQKNRKLKEDFDELKKKIAQIEGKSENLNIKNSELASQELEISQARNKTLSEKNRRQKEAIVGFNEEIDGLRKKVAGLEGKLQGYHELVNENKELLKRICKFSEDIRSKDEEIKELAVKISQMAERHEKSNNSLVFEVNRLGQELENCKKCEKLQEIANKAKEEVAFYRTQCDTMSANLSRAQAQIRKSSVSRRQG